MNKLFLPFIFLATTVPLLTHAQQTKTRHVLTAEEARTKHDQIMASRTVPTKDNEQYAPYWTAEGGWHTELQLRNNLIKEKLIVTPILRAPDGTETTLNQVTILPGEVQSINLNNALVSVNSGLVGAANAYGSIVLRYNSPNWRNLYASVMVHDTGHPIMYHLDAIGGFRQKGSTTT